MTMFNKKEQTQFRQVGSLFISAERGDHDHSKELLAENGLRMLTYREAFANAPELVKELKGKWFFLAGEVTDKSGIFTYDAKGELVRPTCDEVYDKKIRVYPGNTSLVLDVDDNTTSHRFCLDGREGKSEVALAIVGIRVDPGLERARRA